MAGTVTGMRMVWTGIGLSGSMAFATCSVATHTSSRRSNDDRHAWGKVETSHHQSPMLYRPSASSRPDSAKNLDRPSALMQNKLTGNGAALGSKNVYAWP